MIYLDVEQGSQEWLDARLGIPTASEISCLLVDGKTLPPFGQGALTYADTLVAERFRGQSANEFVGNDYTERGHDLEPIVAEYYTSCGYSDEPVTTCGICINHGMGASPDRLVGDKGGLEIKTLNPKAMVTLLRNGKVNKDHIAQVQATLWVTEREWWDYIVYCDGMPSFYQRMQRDEKMIDKIDERVCMFNELVSEIEQAIISGYMPNHLKV